MAARGRAETRKGKRRRQGGTSCSVFGCRNAFYNNDCTNLSFYQVPRDEERCKVWIQNSRRRDLLGKSAQELNKKRYTFCAIHFESSQFTVPSERKRLNWNAIPTLFDVPGSGDVVDEPHRAWVGFKDEDGSIVTTHCTCMDGSSVPVCVHSAAIIFKVEATLRSSDATAFNSETSMIAGQVNYEKESCQEIDAHVKIANAEPDCQEGDMQLSTEELDKEMDDTHIKNDKGESNCEDGDIQVSSGGLDLDCQEVDTELSFVGAKSKTVFTEAVLNEEALFDDMGRDISPAPAPDCNGSKDEPGPPVRPKSTSNLNALNEVESNIRSTSQATDLDTCIVTKDLNGFRKCKICSLVFSSKHSLGCHMMRQHKESIKRMVTEMVHTGLEEQQKNGHLNKSSRRRFSCAVCRRTFSYKDSLMAHIRLKHPNGKFTQGTGSQCGDGLIDTSALIQSVVLVIPRRRSRSIINSQEKMFKCSHCEQEFTPNRDKAFARHMKTHGVDSPFKCTECGRSFTGLSNLTNHMMLHSGENRCDVCGMSFVRSENLSAHLRRHLSSNEKNLKKDKCAQCDKCPKRFINMFRLKIHMRTHTGERPFKCTQCDKAFMSNHARKIHMAGVHAVKKPFQCDVCDRSFSFSANMHRHKKLHTGDFPFQCQICDKKFIQKVNLTSHMRLHAEGGPLVMNRKSCFYKCEPCKLNFSTVKEFDSHARTHIEKPYKCDVCGKVFSCDLNRQRHMRIHTGLKPFLCHVCGKVFSQKGNLEAHKRTHTGEKPFKCEKCHRAYCSKANLCKHTCRSTPPI